MSERETRDFMSVDAFSQLPFIRPAAPANKEKNSSTGIRIFGIQVPHQADNHQEEMLLSSSKENTIYKTTNSGNGNGKGRCTTTTTTTTTKAPSAGESTRKFECHYCRRNFPTSQALGGHQNAHKRERQNAKRAHLRTALAASHHHQYHNHHPVITEAHLNNFVNYHRSVGPLSPSSRFSIGRAFDSHSAPHYSSWSTTGDIGTVGSGNYPVPRFYGGSGSTVSQPINGNPVFPGLWRVTPPQAREIQIPPHRDRSMQALPLFGGEAALTDSPSSSTLPAPPQIPFSYEAKAAGVKDHHFSLDLHL